MLISSIIFFVSLFALIGMIAMRLHLDKLRRRELFQPVVLHVKKVDVLMRKGIMKIRRFASFFNKRTFVLLVHYVIEEVEHYFHKFTDFIKRKFPHR